MKRSKNEIIQMLEQNGYRCTHFQLRIEGEWPAEDASWNYRDAISHLNHIHPQVRNIPILIDHDKLASIFLQKLFGLRIPLSVIDYETRSHTQTTCFTWGMFVVVVENICERISPTRSAVITNYQICSPVFFRWAHPIVRWVLRRNYRVLMSQDLPVRERRGILRKWGYVFKDERDNQSYLKSLSIHANHVVSPEVGDLPSETSFDLERNLPQGRRAFFGRDDHLGLQFIRIHDEVLVFKRMCPHQGASLDTAVVSEGKLLCGWHGRKLPPLARINLLADRQEMEIDGKYCLKWELGRLTVSPKGTALG